MKAEPCREAQWGVRGRAGGGGAGGRSRVAADIRSGIIVHLTFKDSSVEILHSLKLYFNVSVPGPGHAPYFGSNCILRHGPGHRMNNLNIL